MFRKIAPTSYEKIGLNKLVSAVNSVGGKSLLMDGCIAADSAAAHGAAGGAIVHGIDSQVNGEDCEE